MNFPRFWTRAEHDGFLAWGWSNDSFDQAKERAFETARRIAQFVNNNDRDHLLRYGYGNRPVREEIIREFRDQAGIRALISRNVYGSLVLNTARLLFVDVDLGEPPELGGMISRWFGSEKRVAEHAAKRNEVILRAEEWARRNSGWNWRIYETRAGLRLAAVHRVFDPGDSICAAVFDWMQADPLYRKLCGVQKCFRARLTPKPWRCGSHAPGERWPFLDDKRAKRFQKWQERYITAASEFATCRLITQTGRNTTPEISDLIVVHDELTRCDSSLPLA